MKNNKQDKKVFIALDPSINETGYAWTVNGDLAAVTSGVIRTRGDNEAMKIISLGVELETILKTPKAPGLVDPGGVAVVEVGEGFTYDRSQGRGNKKTLNAHAMYKNGQAAGALVAVLGLNGFIVETVGATEWKGRTNKKMSKLITGAKNHNEADAILLLRYYVTRDLSRRQYESYRR